MLQAKTRDIDTLLTSIDQKVEELQALLSQASTIPPGPHVPFRRPVMEALQSQLEAARRLLAGEPVDPIWPHRRSGLERRRTS